MQGEGESSIILWSLEEIFTNPLQETRQGQKTFGQKTSVDLWALVSSFGKKREETKVADGTD